MVRTQIQLTEEQAKALKKIAASRHLSIAELIRRAVDTIIKPDAAVDSHEKRNRALEVIGKFSSGRRDVSRKHDSYLANAYSK